MRLLYKRTLRQARSTTTNDMADVNYHVGRHERAVMRRQKLEAKRLARAARRQERRDERHKLAPDLAAVEGNPLYEGLARTLSSGQP